MQPDPETGKPIEHILLIIGDQSGKKKIGIPTTAATISEISQMPVELRVPAPNDFITSGVKTRMIML